MPSIFSRLLLGDIIERVDQMSIAEFLTNRNSPFFQGIEKGQQVEISVRRNGEPVTVLWTHPGLNQTELLARLLNVWWLAYLFWFLGMIAHLNFRPKDTVWHMFVASNYLLALFIMFGSVSSYRIMMSSTLFRLVSWVILPVFLHLHWIFPQSFRPIPLWLKRIFCVVTTGFALAELFRLLPSSLYFLAVAVAFGGSNLLLFLHFLFQPEHRRELLLLAGAALLALLPVTVIGILSINGQVPESGLVSLLGAPVLPVGYFYVLHRRRLGRLEGRTNRAISLYVFLVILGTVLLLLVGYSTHIDLSREAFLFAAVLIALFTTFIGIQVFPRFENLITLKVFGVESSQSASGSVGSSQEMRHRLRVFLCHSSLDKSIVRKLYRQLSKEGWIDAWLDEVKLLPGQDWDMEIEKAVETTDAVLVCLSRHSINKEGYVQKEIRKVLDVSDLKPDGTIFVIPIRLEECDVPRRLIKWQWVNYFEGNAYERIVKSLKSRFDDKFRM